MQILSHGSRASTYEFWGKHNSVHSKDVALKNFDCENKKKNILEVRCMFHKGIERHRLYETGVGNQKQQTSRDKQRVRRDGKCSGNTKICNPETSNYLTKSLR